jgi:DNA-binding transcriptional LysR family regulator
VEFQQLRYVIALAQEANFTRAAARCHVVQSALSHQIKALETELGVSLFARTSRRVELTAAGEAFLPAARISLDAADRAVADAAAATGQIRGNLRIGVIPTVTAINLPATLRAFRHRHPQVQISLRVAGSDELEAGVTDGHLDIGVLGLPANRTPKGVACRDLGTDQLVVVLNHQHPLTKRERVSLADLAAETFADFPAGTPGRAQSDLAFTAAGVHREVAFEALAADLMIDLVREGLAITLLPSRYPPDDPALTTVSIVNAPTRTEYLAWSMLNPSPTTQAFLAIT